MQSPHELNSSSLTPWDLLLLRTYTSFVRPCGTSICPCRLRCLFLQAQAEMKMNMLSSLLLQLNWMRILLNFFMSSVSWMLANVMTKSSSCCFWKCNRNSAHRSCITVCPDSGWSITYLSTPIIESWLKSVGSDGSLSQLFMMKVMVWCFVSNSQLVTTAHIAMCVLPSNCCCCGDYFLQFHR